MAMTRDIPEAATIALMFYNVSLSIYIYIERERDVYIYIYIHICIYREREIERERDYMLRVLQSQVNIHEVRIHRQMLTQVT